MCFKIVKFFLRKSVFLPRVNYTRTFIELPGMDIDNLAINPDLYRNDSSMKIYVFHTVKNRKTAQMVRDLSGINLRELRVVFKALNHPQLPQIVQ
jgi:hypothetical protein